MEFKVLYEDEDVLVLNKPACIIVFSERPTIGKSLTQLLFKKLPYFKRIGKPPRYGVVHRLDKETSGILLIAKNNKSLFFLQKQFKERKVVKKYIALLSGNLKKSQGKIETLIGRSPRDRTKQKVYLAFGPKSKGKRKAVTKYKVLTKFKDYTLVEVNLKTGRKHQIRAHFHYLGYPVAGDKVYSFKNQAQPKDLKRQFLHATYLRIKLPNNQEKEFKSELPEDLKKVLKGLGY